MRAPAHRLPIRRRADRRLPVVAAVAAMAMLAVAVPIPGSAAETSPPPGGWPTTRAMTFPVAGTVSYWDDFGQPRSGGRTHQGNDLMGRRLQPLVAAADGVVAWVKTSNEGNAGNMLALRDGDGWEYWYIHLNNDSPGTDDGANPPQWILFPQVRAGTYVVAGQPIAYLGDSGNAEGTAPHLHFEVHAPDGTPVNPYDSLRAAARPAATRVAAVAARPGGGHYVLDRRGRVHAYGGAPHHGHPDFGFDVARDLAVMPDGQGYVILDGWGGLHRYGSARTTLGGLATAYFRGMDVARSIAVMPDGKGVVVLDGWGGLHLAGSAAGLPKTAGAYWPGWDIARAVAPMPDGKGLVVLDGWGGVHRTGSATGLRTAATPWWPGWDVARDVVVSPDGEGLAVLDGLGGIHGRGSLASIGAPTYAPGSDWRSLSLVGSRAVAARVDGLSDDWKVALPA